ncbi:MAG: S8 family serine peptidase [Rhodopseudomonas sp.]|nr:S8 family serine peptidase [Rhodopseudomonas sp.]
MLALATVAALLANAPVARVQAQLRPPTFTPPPVVPPPTFTPPPVVPPPTLTPPPIVPPVVPPLQPTNLDPGRTPRGTVPDVLPMVDREFRRLRHTRITPSQCNYLNGGATCAPLWVIDDWRGGNGGKKRKRVPREAGGVRRASPRAVAARSFVPDQIVVELDGALTDAQTDTLARRHRLTRLGSQRISLLDSTIALFRIGGRRSPQTVVRELGADVGVRSVQSNFLYALQGDKPAAAAEEGDPAQYALTKLRLPQAHALSRGGNVIVAVIDSGIDGAHPELAEALAGSFDALISKQGPHLHGTGIAGAIAAHARLIGSAPSAKILAIRAFGTAKAGAESTSFVILKSLDYAASHGARIVNMSFAGPNDPLIARGLAAVAAKGIVMVAASGNAGPTSPPLYPAANPSVIAVSATDSSDGLFAASNRGSHIAVAAPGVDIFLPAPGGKYEMMSGTSFSAAYVSGVVALMIARDPLLKPDQVRAILTQTAHDLGAPGRDDLFGAGEVDAFAAVSAVQGGAIAAPAVAIPEPSAAK